MKHRQEILALAGAFAVACVSVGGAQATADTAHQATDSTVAQPKHGLFGKLKGLAKNKTAQTIAKAAACTMIPGGQYVVGAIDAKQSKSVAGAAASVAGAASGSGCLPGMGGIGGLGGMKGMGAGGAAIAAANAASLTSATLMQAQMQEAMQGGKIPAGGITTTVSNGNVQAMAAQMQAAAMQMQTANVTTAGIPTEAAGQQLQLSGDPASELAKGRLVIKHVDWMQETAGLSAPATPAFIDAMAAVGNAIKQGGGSYRVDVYMDKRYSDTVIANLGPQRVAMVVSVLQDRAQVGDAAQLGKYPKDKEQRIEIVKIK